VASVDGWRDIIIAQRGWPLEEPRPLSKLHDEHEAILRAVRDRDPYTAAQAMHHHLVQTGTNAMKELLRENPKAGAYDPSWHDSIPKPHRRNTACPRPTSELTALTDNPPNEPASARHK
jgi:hypothetical protein